MFAINKNGTVFTISFETSYFGMKSVKTLKKSTVHANRKGWPNEWMPLADGRHSDDPCKGSAELVVCDDKFQEVIGTVGSGFLCNPHYSEREYRAIELA